MEFRVQTGDVDGDAWLEGDIDLSFEAVDFSAAVARAPDLVLTHGLWIETDSWLRVIGHGQEHRWPPKARSGA